jgi:pimeloyl-ACP methyl ester carboxylesterase
MGRVKGGLLGVLGVGAAAALLIPIPSLKDTVPPEQLADPDSRFAVANGIKLHYKLAGSGEPAMILLHGFGASTFSWREVMAPLARLGTVVAYDRPSSGLTERPLPGDWTGDNPYGPAAQVEQLIGLMDLLNLRQAILIGNSAGGTVAVQAALRYPDRVAALVLVDAAIYASGGPPSWVRPLLRTAPLRRIGPLIARSIKSQGERLLELAWHDPAGITPEIRAGYRKALQADNWDRGLWELAAASRDPNLDARLAEVRQPTLVITGDDDRVVPTAGSIRLAGELPNAELAVIPACGHVPHEECPEPFLAVVTEFISRFQGAGVGTEPSALVIREEFS